MLGSLLVGGNAVPGPNGEIYSDFTNKEQFLEGTVENWQKLAELLNVPTPIQTPDGTLDVYPLLGTDAVHGNQHVVGEVLFPHNIGLAATHNPQNFFEAGYHNGASVKASGWNYAFSPTVAASHNYQWGRFYESMGADPKMIQEYAAAYVAGIQMPDPISGGLKGVLASVKHFLGDGATYLGVDEGNATVHDFKSFLDVNMAGYHGGIESCAGNVMCSYSAVNRIPMSINAELVEGVLKEEAKFDGFVISDYDEVGKVEGQGWPTSNIKMDRVDSIANIINAGSDMMMLASTNSAVAIDYYQKPLKGLVESGAVSMDRINDAVTRILAVKKAMGLITKHGEAVKTTIPEKPVGVPESHESALKAAQESLVLLENEQETLPLDFGSYTHIVLMGEREEHEALPNWQTATTTFQDFDNIGAQNGGWSVAWQGYNGNFFWADEHKERSHSSSILDALKARIDTSKT